MCWSMLNQNSQKTLLDKVRDREEKRERGERRERRRERITTNFTRPLLLFLEALLLRKAAQSVTVDLLKTTQNPFTHEKGGITAWSFFWSFVVDRAT